jgi:wyosine [tRNA(Phe)-imidazoG37] synthetase (radical SAM superfamily)
VEGLVQLRQEYQGQIWLEVFLVEGINATEAHCLKIKELADRIHPDRIHLNTAVRPTTEPGIRAVSRERMEELCRLFGPRAEVIADYARGPGELKAQVTPEAVLEMLARRPCTLADIAAGLAANPLEVTKALGLLQARGKIRQRFQAGRTYFQLAS